MTVTAFRVQNFMGFEDSGWIELRPITLLFGRNSSGKSALIRALLLLRQSLESEPGDGALLFVKDDGFDYGDYSELVIDHAASKDMSFWFRVRFSTVDKHEGGEHLRRALDAINHFTVSGSAPTDERPDTQTLTVRLIIGQSVQGLTDLKGLDIYTPTGELILRADKTDQENNSKGPWMIATDFFDLDEDNSGAAIPDFWKQIEFFVQRGFLPWIRPMENVLRGIEEDTPAEDDARALGENFLRIWLILRGIRRSISSSLEQIDYLGPLRSSPQRFYYVAGKSLSVPERGKNFVRNLVKAESSTLKAINEWLNTSGIPYQLHLQPLDSRKTLYELRLQEISDGRSTKGSANIREVGFGITQMLPIITQAVLAQPGDTLIIEQPELHLHPRAQTELGNLFIALAQKDVNCVIETHSEHLLLRLQKQVAKTTTGQVDEALPGQMLLPSQVGVYFVNRKEKSTARRIEIGPYGDLLSTPDGFEDFFSDDMLETAERMRARLSHRS
jgi:predicted ATPase